MEVIALSFAHRSRFAIVTLVLIYIFGASSLYGLLFRNGCYEALLKLRDEGPHHLPGSSNPILTRYTGISFLDRLLTLATVVFANVTDGSSPALSLYAFHFAGQYLAILLVLAIEGLRAGNRSTLLRFFPLWGCAMQITSYGCTMPLYGVLHLITSPTARDTRLSPLELISTSNLLDLSVLPQAFILGYVIPAILMSLPFSSNRLHQWFGGLWQGSPIWVAAIQQVLVIRLAKHRQLHYIHNGQRISHSDSKKRLPTENPESALSLVRAHEDYLLSRCYSFAFAFCLLSQFIPIILIMATTLFPTAFSPELREAWTLYNVFLPPPFYSTEKMKSMATGMHDFFLYDQYVGSTAAIVWATTLYVTSRETTMIMKSWIKLASGVTGLSLLAGPAGAVVWLMWERDQTILLQ
ncbi:hypothetical protein F4779DRAFT_599396 [Xylariaceae sp. FL0662B]|nr:hypothetical protein F4779DRAFT_599396 [Xylariaceae sp. FL0662B]